MGLLERFEDSLDRLVNGAFARAFKAEVQPVEIASALQREMDDRAAALDRARTVIPNVFHIELSKHDFTRLSVFKEALQTELAAHVHSYASEQHYTLLGAIDITLAEDDELETGIFRVRSQAKAEVRAAGETPAADLSAQPRLVIGKSAYPLVRAVTRVGRGSDADIQVDDPGVSRNHCEIVLGSPVLLRDLGSTNGTLINGLRINEAPIEDGTALTIGSTTLVFRNG